MKFKAEGPQDRGTSSNVKCYALSMGSIVSPGTGIQSCGPKARQASRQMGLCKTDTIELVTERPREQQATSQ